MATLFTKIINGEIPGTFVWRDEQCVGFMSINPLRPGHTLVVPRLEVDHWVECPPKLRGHLFDVSQTISAAIAEVHNPQKIGLLIAGLEVPHMHIHLVPIDGVHDLDFANASTTTDRDDLEQTAAAIRDVLKQRKASGVSE